MNQHSNPMNGEEIRRCAAEIRDCVAAVRRQLLQPQILPNPSDIARLSDALAGLERIQASCRAPILNGALRTEMRDVLTRLAAETSGAAHLAQNASQHSAAWLRWLSMHFQGYSPLGEMNQLQCTGQVDLKG